MNRQTLKEMGSALLPIILALTFGIYMGYTQTHKTITHEIVISSCERVG